MPTVEERLAELEAQRTEIDRQVKQLQLQQALTVEAFRRTLQGLWDDAKNFVDAVDPAEARNWDNVPFPSGPAVQVPPITWKGSPNFWPGLRPGHPPIAIVVHTMGGTMGGTASHFATTASQVSAHFGVGLNGEAHGYVKLGDRAWANGILEPGNRWFGPGGVSPNDVTVSIETEDRNNPNQAVTDAQFNTTLALGRLICATFPSIRFVTSHHLISPINRPGCCGKRWTNSGRLTALADALDLELRV